MSQDALPSQPFSPPPPFRAVLTPHRSLSPRGFLILMGAVGVVSFVAGIFFMMIGAWPVFAFFGLDAALVWLAFRLNYRSGRQLEVVEIADGTLTLTRVDPKGRSAVATLPAIWTEVRFREAVDGRTSLAVASRGQELAFGHFLTDDERREFSAVLRDALLIARGGPRI